MFANLHARYVDKKDEIFDGEMISREGFMDILGEILDTWRTKKSCW